MNRLDGSVRTALFVVIFIFIAFFLYTKIIGPIPFTVNSIVTSKVDLFTADGKGEATAIPDTAQLNIGVTKTATTVTDAQNQANTVVKQMLDEFKKLGIQDKHIKTMNYSVYPQYDYTGTTQRTTGYTVTQDLQVKVTPIENANKALDIAVAKGANVAGGIVFVLDDEKKKALEEEARKEAIENAKEKAMTMSRLAGIRLGRIINVYESPYYDEPPIVSLESRSLDGKDQPVEPSSVQPGENTVRINVSISYETL